MRAGLRRRISSLLMAAGIGMALLGAGSAAHAASWSAGAVYALTNAVDGNAVVIYARSRDGRLTPVGSAPTGGTGTGAGLGSQGAVSLSKNERLLFAVNAGSNDVSVFEVRGDSLTLVNRTASGGEKPISLTVHDDTLFVLNAGGSGNITGFQITDDGALEPIMGSTRPLSSGASDPAQVQFNNDGDMLAVSEKAANMITTYAVDENGMPSAPMAQPSAGQTPFGFVFGPRNRLIVSEAFGGAAGAGAVSSYTVADDGRLQTLTASAANMQGAPCWVALGKRGRFAYIANTGSGTVSAYRVERSGELALLNPEGVAASTGADSKPADLALTDNGRLLYVRNGGTGTIAGFAVQPDGSLTALGESGSLAAGATGLAVR